MLFDHGTDSLCSFFISIQVLEMIEVDNAYLKVFCLFTYVMIIYFCAMWSQYSIGYFRLGRVNPVDEGLPLTALTAVACVYLPEQFWTQKGVFIKLNE